MNDSIYDRSSRGDELLVQLVNQQKKLLLHYRLATLFSLLLCVVLIAGFFRLAVPVRAELQHVESSLTEIDQLAADAGTLIENANAMVTDSTEAVSGAVETLNEVDIDSLNEAIQNLSEATVPPGEPGGSLPLRYSAVMTPLRQRHERRKHLALES